MNHMFSNEQKKIETAFVTLIAAAILHHNPATDAKTAVDGIQIKSISFLGEPENRASVTITFSNPLKFDPIETVMRAVEDRMKVKATIGQLPGEQGMLVHYITLFRKSPSTNLIETLANDSVVMQIASSLSDYQNKKGVEL